MLYADTDFFVALLKKSDWLKQRAHRVLAKHRGEIITSATTIIELLLIAKECGLDPERLIVDVSQIANIEDGHIGVLLVAANYIKEEGVGVFDALHAAFCGKRRKIISSDRIFDDLGFDRVRLEAA